MKKNRSDHSSNTMLLQGNEAIARGAVEAGIDFTAAYPGTPSTEILTTLSKVAKKHEIYVEWSVNEKVALEAATAASLSNLRALTAMKHNGLNVALDFISTLVMKDTVGGNVLVVCDDPDSRNSSNEQDTRIISKWLGIPSVEPSNMQEAKDMTKWLFDLSEELETVCILRSVAKISHTYGNVEINRIDKKEKTAKFDRSRPPHFPGVLGRIKIEEKLKKAREIFEKSDFNWYEGPDYPEFMIITSGSGWLYSNEFVKSYNLGHKIGILKIGTLWPLPEQLILSHLANTDSLVFIEETDPYLEDCIYELIGRNSYKMKHIKGYGKRNGYIEPYGELRYERIESVFNKLLPLNKDDSAEKCENELNELAKETIIQRTGSLCPGCPHKASFYCIKKALKADGRKGFVTGDIGCYTAGLRADGFHQVKTVFAMGSSVGLASGFGVLDSKGFDQPVIAICGDSTFYHSIMPGLVNGIYNNSNFVLAILDNSATAMTGFQPHPGTGLSASGKTARKLSIESICKAMGVSVEVCDPFDMKQTTSTLKNALSRSEGVSVVILKRECAIISRKKKKNPFTVSIDQDKCLALDGTCPSFCVRFYKCAAMYKDPQTNETKIDKTLCTGCCSCIDVCKHRAIIKRQKKEYSHA